MTSQTPQPAPASNSPQPTATPPAPAKQGGLLAGPFGVVLSVALLGTAGYLTYRALYQALKGLLIDSVPPAALEWCYECRQRA